MKTALIMEGGAMRGMFTCGVMDVLMENGITFDGAAGISAGAVFGSNFKSGQVGRPLRYNRKYCRDPRYCSIRSLIRTGDLYGADFCYRELPDVLDPFDREAFRLNPMDFHVGATDVDTGECVFRRCTDGGETDMLWFRASASMPAVSRPVRIGGRRYLDGGITDAVPYAYMEKLGYDRNVIILTQPRGYRKKPDTTLLMMRRLPKIREAMERRHVMYNRQMDELDRMEAEKTALVIRPPEALRIGHTEKNPDELERVYRTGRAEAEKRLPEIRQWLAVRQEPDPDSSGLAADRLFREGEELREQGNTDEAYRKYEQAAGLGSTEAMLAIAGLYMNGFRAVQQSSLAEVLLKGGAVFPWDIRTGKQPDVKSVFEWTLKAAEAGNPNACELAGLLLCEGAGCRPDPETGLKYLETALENGIPSAQKWI